MKVIAIDVMDGRGLIEVAVDNWLDAERLQDFLREASYAISEISEQRMHEKENENA